MNRGESAFCGATFVPCQCGFVPWATNEKSVEGFPPRFRRFNHRANAGTVFRTFSIAGFVPRLTPRRPAGGVYDLEVEHDAEVDALNIQTGVRDAERLTSRRCVAGSQHTGVHIAIDL